MRKTFTFLAAATAALTLTAAPAKAPLRGHDQEPVRKSAPRQCVQTLKAPAQDLSQLPLTVDVPEGTDIREYSRDSRYFALDYTGQFTYQEDLGLISEVGYGTDGKVYIHNPYGGIETNTWLVGTRVGDKVSVELPQKIYEESYPWWDENGDEFTMTDTYYAFRLLYSTDGETSRMNIDNTNQTVTFEVTPDGLVMTDDSDVFIGLLLSREETDAETGEPVTTLGWTGYADTALTFSTVTDEPVRLPATASLTQWVLTDTMGQRLVNAGFDGDDFYLQGLFTSAPEMTVKGTLRDGKVVFPTGQYMGKCLRYGHYSFFIPAEYTLTNPDDPEEAAYFGVEEMTFTYDPEKRTLTPDAPYQIFISTIPDGIFYLEAYRDVELAWQDNVTPMSPCNPVLTDLNMDGFDDYGYGYCAYEIPETSTDGRLLDLDRLYYNFLADGEEVTYYPDEDPDLTEPLTDIPYYYEDSCIYFWGDYHEAMLFTAGFEHFGIRLFYLNQDGTKTFSDAIYWDGWTGVSETGIGADVVSEEYFSTDGRRMAKPEEGIAIRRARLSDGSVKVSKIVVK